MINTWDTFSNICHQPEIWVKLCDTDLVGLEGSVGFEVAITPRRGNIGSETPLDSEANLLNGLAS